MTNLFRVTLLWTITSLFFCRVYGQFLVTYMEPDWLPALPYWFSGYLEYQYLLGAQILILMLMAVINVDYFRKAGYFYIQSNKKRVWLKRFCGVYLTVMTLRLILHFTLFTEQVWYINIIPISFHWLLAGYLWLLSVDLEKLQK
ncbi:hypothetical protein [Pleionea sediminis]|uniref:hypothetical protein n=1 Tax=Pleionea sediminis TaxID=2569479 RepID=UPI0011871D41|nr:hypothetical protein [Pleionea sediminis]